MNLKAVSCTQKAQADSVPSNTQLGSERECVIYTQNKTRREKNKRRNNILIGLCIVQISKKKKRSLNSFIFRLIFCLLYRIRQCAIRLKIQISDMNTRFK